MKRPVRSPNPRSSSSTMRAVLVLPLVPAIRMTGYAELRLAEQVRQGAYPVERRSDARLGPPRDECLLDASQRRHVGVVDGHAVGSRSSWAPIRAMSASAAAIRRRIFSTTAPAPWRGSRGCPASLWPAPAPSRAAARSRVRRARSAATSIVPDRSSSTTSPPTPQRRRRGEAVAGVSRAEPATARAPRGAARATHLCPRGAPALAASGLSTLLANGTAEPR